ncbi:2-keto-4-pentenoate hydratase [Bradyrhizobium sp. McL0615]|uniref:2-keto-4-pentenoate hydratase n=1 Tax=Bradyrhizobium sp. McL0615 TaxID=3415673 RepID=UPI003CEC4997
MAIDLAAAIEDFWIARKRGEFFPRAYYDKLTLDDAYRIQLALIDRRVAAGERQIGWKVGLTAKAIQEQFGFHEPIFACLLETQPSGHVFGSTELINPGIETELCVRLTHGLDGTVSMAQVREAIDVVQPSFEIIETRGDPRQVMLLMADNGQARSVVAGAPVRLTPELALDKVSAYININGQEMASGLGSAVLDNPLNSVLWLARKLGEYGRCLRRNDIVMTGSFVRQFPLTPGDVAFAEFSGIGRVEMGISKA